MPHIISHIEKSLRSGANFLKSFHSKVAAPKIWRCYTWQTKGGFVSMILRNEAQLSPFPPHIPIKKERKITAVKLNWGRKDLPELIEAQMELDRPRVRRAMRRKGKAETIADERAALANSLANALGLSVVENAHEES